MRSTHGAKSKVMTVAEKYVWCSEAIVWKLYLQVNCSITIMDKGVRYISRLYRN